MTVAITQSRQSATGTITAATNATPISITSTAHGRITGDTVTIAGVVGNTAANGSWAITVVDANTFTLNTSVGNGSYVSGGNWCADNASGTNADAVVNYAARSLLSHFCDVVGWSYSAATTGGRITVKDGSAIIWDQDVTAAGAGFLPTALQGQSGNAMEIRLYAGGSTVVGKLNVRHGTS